MRASCCSALRLCDRGGNITIRRWSDFSRPASAPALFSVVVRHSLAATVHPGYLAITTLAFLYIIANLILEAAPFGRCPRYLGPAPGFLGFDFPATRLRAAFACSSPS